jgi:hypothetical protein
MACSSYWLKRPHGPGLAGLARSRGLAEGWPARGGGSRGHTGVLATGRPNSPTFTRLGAGWRGGFGGYKKGASSTIPHKKGIDNERWWGGDVWRWHPVGGGDEVQSGRFGEL